ncbi:MAG: glycosyltransferase family 2 protein [Symploca sp. SIO1C4]|uniref:Glycosyltransferase family 2 protein n=1 Tax=Symploca sp. SIO1C4 TaxID=2607765 RepID=A0A6B3NJC1_9CYAN|nr:glycosyltransferase family 2 protein [Symploca sp. SIO1C4]
MVDFTVAIPTYNGESRLPKVLDKLRSQVNTESFSWEIIVVDNNSKDNTAKVVEEYQANWPDVYPLKYCQETQQGLAFARQRAIDEAQGDFVGFVDDDLLLAPEWVAAAYSFGKEYPQAGAYGGQVHGEFEVQPPENFNRIKSFLAIRERGSKPHLYQPEKLSMPPGGGLVVRKQAWCEHVPRNLTLIGRVNGIMLAGEDYEALLHIYKAGWEIWYSPEMHSYHQIPRRRLEKDYLMSLCRGAGLCICHLRLLNSTGWQKPLIMAKIWLGSLRRTVLHLIKYKWQVKTDLIAACEMEFLLSSMASPFFFLSKSVQDKFAGSRR